MNVPKSLYKDKNDLRALHSPAWREDEKGSPRQYNEVTPLFFTRTGAPIHIEGMYRGAHAFLIANGPSVRTLDLTPLNERWVMTLNNGPATFRGNANCTVDEPSRFNLSTWLDPRIIKFMPLAHYEKPLWDNRTTSDSGDLHEHWHPSTLRPADCPNVIGYRRNEKFYPGRWLSEETINWGNHTKFGGGRSVMLASLRILYTLGFRSVFILGADFDMSPSKRYHFAENRTDASIKGNLSTYAKLQKWFADLQPMFLKAGFFVWNCNPHSRLTAFPYLSYESALEASMATIGVPKVERTEGMYQKWEDKTGQKQESPALATPSHQPSAQPQDLVEEAA